MYLFFDEVKIGDSFIFEGIIYTKISDNQATNIMGYTDILNSDDDCFVEEI